MTTGQLAPAPPRAPSCDAQQRPTKAHHFPPKPWTRVTKLGPTHPGQLGQEFASLLAWGENNLPCPHQPKWGHLWTGGDWGGVALGHMGRLGTERHQTPGPQTYGHEWWGQ